MAVINQFKFYKLLALFQLAIILKNADNKQMLHNFTRIQKNLTILNNACSVYT